MDIKEYTNSLDNLVMKMNESFQLFSNEYGTYPFIYNKSRINDKKIVSEEFILGMAHGDDYMKCHTHEINKDVWCRPLDLETFYKTVVEWAENWAKPKKYDCSI